jgi:hypothetical protein
VADRKDFPTGATVLPKKNFSIIKLRKQFVSHALVSYILQDYIRS